MNNIHENNATACTGLNISQWSADPFAQTPKIEMLTARDRFNHQYCFFNEFAT
jgi:hypothetical protein